MSTYKTIAALPCACALHACLLGAANVAAQQLDPVVVTATRFAERRFDAPIGVRVIEAEEISASAAQSLPELLNRLGGLHIRNSTGTPDSQLDLRGFGATSDQNTLVLLDGVRINEVDGAPTRLSTVPLDAIERIEILPGSGAVQYGGGATGGTINIITKSPRAGARTGGLTAGFASYGTTDLRGNATIAGDRLGLTLHADRFETDNFRPNNAVRQQSALGDLRMLGGGPTLALKFGVDRQEVRFPGALSEAQILANPRQSTRLADFARREGGFGTLTGSAKLGGADLAADLAWRGSTSVGFFDGFGPFSFNESKLRGLTFSPRARWSIEGSMSHAFVAGVDVYDWKWDRRTAANSGSLANPAAHQDATQTGQAVYAQYRVRLPARTQVQLGGRLERVDDALRTDITANEQRRTRNVSAVELALRQPVTASLSVLAKAGTSFRLPHVFENNGDQLLEPQTARTYELGLDSRARAVSWRINAYLTRLKNEIYFSPFTPNPLFGFPGANINLSPTERRGLELGGDWQPTPTLELAASLAVQRATFTEGIYGGVDVRGKDVPLVPRTIASVRAAWRVLPKTRLAASYVHAGKQRFDGDQDNTFGRTMPAYGLLDLTAIHEIGPLVLTAGVRNALDEQYFSYGFVATGATTFSAYPQAGRTIFGSVEYRFR